MKKKKFLLAGLAIFLASQTVSAQEAKILANHVGYETAGPKLAVILGHQGDAFTQFNIKKTATGETVLSGVPKHAGPVRKWKDWDFWTIDWSGVAAEGSYLIECASPKGTIRSHPVSVQKNVLERNTLSDVIYYFKGQRSSGLWDKADRKMRFEGKEGVVDVHGGWFDATGDYGKHLSHLSFSTYFNPQQISLTAWSLFKSLRELERRDEPYFKQYQKRLLDEALFGADYLVRIKDPAGSFYITVSGRGPEKKPEDRLIAPKAERHIILTPETKDKFRDYGKEKIKGDAAFEAAYREGAGLSIAALAMASAARGSGDFANADYLKAAEDAFAFLEKNNLHFTNDGQENILDDYCALVAATELYRATKNSKYKTAADKRATGLTARLTASGPYKDYWRADDGDRPFFHPVDAGLPVVSLLDYCEIADAAIRAKVLDAVKRSLAFELALTGEVTNPFGYSRQLVQSKDGSRRTSFFFPHDTETAPWWQGENARLGSMAAAARLAVRHFQQDKGFQAKLAAFGRSQLNWILGLNPFDACMLHGKGRNNIPYMFFNSYEYTNAPGGIPNGVTGGYTDEDDIDFGLHYAVTGKDDDWRWAEEWLPHAAWYLYAVALGEQEK
jgi:hypothetical protein